MTVREGEGEGESVRACGGTGPEREGRPTRPGHAVGSTGTLLTLRSFHRPSSPSPFPQSHCSLGRAILLPLLLGALAPEATN